MGDAACPSLSLSLLNNLTSFIQTMNLTEAIQFVPGLSCNVQGTEG